MNLGIDRIKTLQHCKEIDQIKSLKRLVAIANFLPFTINLASIILDI
uniref:Uncharacterized protein n=1 Tax=uncultured Desulfobacterium sp. TaxID=201089 RepID=E1YIU7_9BACT|nr:unknown protein [uncultured Desulfobacterium sp.]